MRRAERVVLALVALGEAGQATALAQGTHAVASPCQDLVRIALVANIEDQLVIGRIEHGMDRHGELNDAEARSKVPTGHRDNINDFLADLLRNLFQFRPRPAFEVVGRIDRIEKPVWAEFGHLSLDP